MPSASYSVSTAWTNLTTAASFSNGDRVSLQATDPRATIYLWEGAMAPVASDQAHWVPPGEWQEIKQPETASVWIRASEACKVTITNL